MEEFVCKRCCTSCTVDGDYPKFFCWCDNCGDYADGFNPIEYAREHLSNLIDFTYDSLKEK